MRRAAVHVDGGAHEDARAGEAAADAAQRLRADERDRLLALVEEVLGAEARDARADQRLEHRDEGHGGAVPEDQGG